MMMKNAILFLVVVLLAIIPLYVVNDSEFAGADGEAEDQIVEIAPDYEPWFDSIWEPPGGETESLLFALQAVIGALIIGYIFGYSKARKSFSNRENVNKKDVIN